MHFRLHNETGMKVSFRFFFRSKTGKEMYIVKKGRLSVVSEDGQTVFANLTDGAVFGELSVLNIQGKELTIIIIIKFKFVYQIKIQKASIWNYGIWVCVVHFSHY